MTYKATMLNNQYTKIDTSRNAYYEMNISNRNNGYYSMRLMQICLCVVVTLVVIVASSFVWTIQRNTIASRDQATKITSMKYLAVFEKPSRSNLSQEKESFDLPDLTFTLTTEQNDERLNYIQGHREKDVSGENEDEVDDSSSSSNEMSRTESLMADHRDYFSTTGRDSSDDGYSSASKDTDMASSSDLYRPDLSFTLTSKQSEERLEFMTSKLKISTSIDSVDKYHGDDKSRSTDVDDDSDFDSNVADERENVAGDDVKSDNNPRLCRRNEIIEGKWTREVLIKPPYITPTVHLRCYPHDAYYDSVNGWNTWKWEPNAKGFGSCEFNSFFSRKDFCNLMQDGVVSIIGDSLSWEHYSSLVQLNGLKTHQTYQHQSHELQMNIFQTVCNGRAKVLYRYDDKLQNLTSSIQTDFPVVLVLNRGAHYKPDEELLPDIRRNIEELKESWIPRCESYKIKCHLFWRTSVPGHPGCFKKISVNNKSDSSSKTQFTMAYTEPVNDLERMEDLIGDLTNYDNRTINYHWYDYQRQNEFVVQELQEAFSKLSETSPYFTFEIIDAYYLNVRRPDEHRAHQEDCLHNCYPGKMDMYNVLLVHYLLQQRSNDDVETLHKFISKTKLWNVNETTKHDREATDKAREIREGKSKTAESSPLKM